MRIAANIDPLAEESERARYLTHLFEALGTIDGVNDYLMLSHRSVAKRPTTPSTFAWEDVTVSGPSERLKRIRWEQQIFAEVARRRGAKMIYIPYFAPPLRSALPVIATVPDLLTFALQDYRPSTTQWLYQQLLGRAARRVAMIICSSEFIKAESIRLLEIPAERIVVIPTAPPPQFRPVTDASRLRALRSHYSIGERFITYCGGFDARKNLTMLIGAFAAAMHRIGDSTLQLVLAGDSAQLGSNLLYPDWRPLARKFGIESRIIMADVAYEDLPVLYTLASCFVYPSEYEGDGRTVLEAMACGAPAIISDQPALQEATGSAALSFPLAKASDGTTNAAMRALANQLARLLAAPEVREEYHQRSLARASQFTWAQVAGETSAV
ncbi:MAG TPA: glycosyltransferase family 1 protein, partial [Ktedonobacterales bacterium]|nr:glycosyltransferase family 1 protein [Ktedonobacterales bacterium]